MRLHGVHGRSHMFQLFHYRGVRAGKDCIGSCQYLQIVDLCLHSLHDCLNVFYHLMVLFCRGRWCTIDFFHFRGVPPFSCGCYRSFLISLLSVKEYFVFILRLKVRIFSSLLSDAVIENPRLRQKGDSYGHHHGVGDFMASCSRELPPLFQLFN